MPWISNTYKDTFERNFSLTWKIKHNTSCSLLFGITTTSVIEISYLQDWNPSWSVMLVTGNDMHCISSHIVPRHSPILRIALATVPILTPIQYKQTLMAIFFHFLVLYIPVLIRKPSRFATGLESRIIFTPALMLWVLPFNGWKATETAKLAHSISWTGSILHCDVLSQSLNR